MRSARALLGDPARAYHGTDEGDCMPNRFESKYRLVSEDTEMKDRPCWIQKVPRSKDLYVLSQAMKASEPDFPNVETMLAEISREGEIREYGRKPVLAHFTRVNVAGKGMCHAVEWCDGSNVTWVEDSN